jgi:hypothetical protein
MLWVCHAQALTLFYGFAENKYLPDEAMLWLGDELSRPDQAPF